MLRSNKIINRTLVAFCAAVFLAIPPGCESSEADTPEVMPVENSVDDGFDSAQALVDHLVALDPYDALLASYDLTVTNNQTEEMLLRFRRNIAKEQRRHAEAVNAAFGNGSEIVPQDLGLPEIVDGWRNGDLVALGGSRMTLDYMERDGKPGTLVLYNNRGRWKIHARSLNFAREDISEVWYFRNQFPLMAQLKAFRDVTPAVEAGDFASADDVSDAIDTIVTGPQLPIGSVVPDP